MKILVLESSKTKIDKFKSDLQNHHLTFVRSLQMVFEVINKSQYNALVISKYDDTQKLYNDQELQKFMKQAPLKPKLILDITGKYLTSNCELTNLIESAK